MSFDRGAMRHRIKAIEAEVQSKLKDPYITGAELKSFMDKAEGEWNDISGRLKSYDRSLAFRAGSEVRWVMPASTTPLRSAVNAARPTSRPTLR
jgi:hypothetical protein